MRLTLEEARLLCRILEGNSSLSSLHSKEKATLNRIRLKADIERRDLAKNAKTEDVIQSL